MAIDLNLLHDRDAVAVLLVATSGAAVHGYRQLPGQVLQAFF